MSRKFHEMEIKDQKSTLRKNEASPHIKNPYKSYQNFGNTTFSPYQQDENSLFFDIHTNPLESAPQEYHYINQLKPMADKKSYKFQQHKSTPYSHALIPQKYSNLNYVNEEKNYVNHVSLYKNQSIRQGVLSTKVSNPNLRFISSYENVNKDLQYPFKDSRREANSFNNTNQNDSTSQYSNCIKKRKLERVLPQSTIASHCMPFDASYLKKNDPRPDKNDNVYQVSECYTVGDSETCDNLLGISEKDWNQIQIVEKLLEKEQDVSLVQHLLEELYKSQDVHTKPIDQILISLFKNYLSTHSQKANSGSYEAVREWDQHDSSSFVEPQVASNLPLLDPYDSSACQNGIHCDHIKIHASLKCQDKRYHTLAIQKLTGPYSNTDKISDTLHCLNCSSNASSDLHQNYGNTVSDEHKKRSDSESPLMRHSLKSYKKKDFPPWASQMTARSETSEVTSQLQFSDYCFSNNDNNEDPLCKSMSCSDKSIIKNPTTYQLECHPKKANRLEHSPLNCSSGINDQKNTKEITLKKCCPSINEGIQKIHAFGMRLGNCFKACINHNENSSVSHLNNYISFSKLKTFQLSSIEFPPVSFTIKNLGDIHPNKTKYLLLPKCIVLEQLFLTPELYARFTPNAQCYRVADASGSLILCIVDVTLTNQSKDNHFANLFITSKFKHQLQPSTIIQISDAKLEWVDERMILSVDSIDCVSIKKPMEFPFSREPDMSTFYDNPKNRN